MQFTEQSYRNAELKVNNISKKENGLKLPFCTTSCHGSSQADNTWPLASHNLYVSFLIQ